MPEEFEIISIKITGILGLISIPLFILSFVLKKIFKNEGLIDFFGLLEKIISVSGGIALFIYFMFVYSNSHEPDNSRVKENTSTSSFLTTPIATKTTTEVVDFGSTNIINGGYVWYDGIEYRTADDFYSAITIGEKLYYEDDTAHHIYSCDRKNLSDKVLVYDGAYVDELTYYGGWFYFRRTLDNDVSICKMRTDGSDVRVLVQCDEWYMNIYQDKIYFVNFDENYALQSMDLEGNQLTTLATNASDICVTNDTIFFSDRETRYLYKMNLDGTDLMQLNHTYTRCTNYYQGKLYYFGDGNHMIYRCDLMGNIEKSYEDGANFLVLAGGYIYAYMDDSQIQKIACD